MFNKIFNFILWISLSLMVGLIVINYMFYHQQPNSFQVFITLALLIQVRTEKNDKD